MGFSILKEFPSRFLSGDEVEGKVVPLIIKDVKKEKAYSPKTRQEEGVLVVYFEDKKKGIRLGKQRASELKEIIGSDDTDEWKGKKVAMYTEKKSINKKNVNVLHFMEAQDITNS